MGAFYSLQIRVHNLQEMQIPNFWEKSNITINMSSADYAYRVQKVKSQYIKVVAANITRVNLRKTNRTRSDRARSACAFAN